jgi:hypothetical protein
VIPPVIGLPLDDVLEPMALRPLLGPARRFA